MRTAVVALAALLLAAGAHPAPPAPVPSNAKPRSVFPHLAFLGRAKGGPLPGVDRWPIAAQLLLHRARCCRILRCFSGSTHFCLRARAVSCSASRPLGCVRKQPEPHQHAREPLGLGRTCPTTRRVAHQHSCSPTHRVHRLRPNSPSPGRSRQPPQGSRGLGARSQHVAGQVPASLTPGCMARRCCSTECPRANHRPQQ